MLADGVRELDEIGLWASWKAYFMGRSRRDGEVYVMGRLIAPYVAAEGLPVLINSVRN